MIFFNRLRKFMKVIGHLMKTRCNFSQKPRIKTFNLEYHNFITLQNKKEGFNILILRKLVLSQFFKAFKFIAS